MDLFEKQIIWFINDGGDDRYMYWAIHNDEYYFLIGNDFPQEERYSLCNSDRELCRFTEWPQNWKLQ